MNLRAELDRKLIQRRVRSITELRSLASVKPIDDRGQTSTAECIGDLLCSYEELRRSLSEIVHIPDAGDPPHSWYLEAQRLAVTALAQARGEAL